MISLETIEEAKKIGLSQAQAVIEFRNRELERRARVIEEIPPTMRLITPFEIKAELISALGPQARDVIVAEGDSWFDYPHHDIVRILEDHHGFDVESVAHKGDRIEEMAYSKGQLEGLVRLIEKILRRKRIPRAILLSGGGNDVAGKEFGMLLNHAFSAIAGLNDNVLKGVIGERASAAYVTIISRVTDVCMRRIGRTVPIIIHGYDYPVPDGRGFLGGWWLLPGPWLEPGFREKGFSELQKRISLARELIDRFNSMLHDVTTLTGFNHVHYIDLRGTLSADITHDKYKDDWGNELHPTESGFEKITARFAQTINALP